MDITFQGSRLIKAGRDRELIGVVLISDKVDSQNDSVSLAELQRASRWYLNNARHVRFNHDGLDLDPSTIELAESFITPPGGMTIEGERIPGGQWVCKFAISQELYERLSKNPPSGFSVGGVSHSRKIGGVNHLKDLQIREISIITSGRPAVPGARLVTLKSQSDEELQAQIESDINECKELLARRQEHEACVEYLASDECWTAIETLAEQKARSRSADYRQWSDDQAAARRRADNPRRFERPRRRTFWNLPRSWGNGIGNWGS